MNKQTVSNPQGRCLVVQDHWLRLARVILVSAFTERTDREQSVVANVVSRWSEVGGMIHDRHAVRFSFHLTIVIDPFRRASPALRCGPLAIGVDDRPAFL